MEYNKKEYIKETGLTEKELTELKKEFVKKYATEKGWECDNLTTEQLKEIYEQETYKNGGLLLS